MPVHELNLKINLSYGENYLQDQNPKANQLMFVFWGILIPIIGIIGVVGNVLTMIVLFRREMKSITVYFLRTLVVTDTAIIFVAILGLSLISITMINPNMATFTDIIYPKIYTPVNYFVMTLQMINVWTTVAVSVERYIAICYPFKSVKICTKRNAYGLIGIIVVVSVLYNIPRCFATSFSACEPNRTDCYSLITTDFGKTAFFEKVYMVYLYMILIYILPLLLLGLLNTMLIAELMRMRKRRSVTTEQDSEANMSLVLILIVVVFICCQSPGLVAQFTFLDPDVLLQWICVSNTLVVVNSSVNFLIYTAVGRKFRQVLFKTFHLIIKRPVNHIKSSYSQNGGTEMARLTNKKSAVENEEVADEKSVLNGGV